MSEHRGLVRSMVRRDFSNRYKGSIIGHAWGDHHPGRDDYYLHAIFSGIFGACFGDQVGHLSFAAHLFCGLLPWIAFSAMRYDNLTPIKAVPIMPPAFSASR